MNTSRVIVTKRILIFASILLCVLFILGISFYQIISAQAKANTPINNSDEAVIRALEEELKNPNLDEKIRKSLQGKLEIFYRDATKRENTRKQLASVPPKTKAAPQIPTIKVSQRKTGIISRPSVPFPSSAYIIENAWQEKIDGNYILVFAGVDAVQAEGGVLIIRSDMNKSFEYYHTPSNSGSIKIIDVKGYQLVLKGQGNQTFYFDVPGRKFISSLGEVAPTVTPKPDYKENATPTPSIPAYP